MSNISILNALAIHFDKPWLLLVLLPAIGLMLIPYLRIPKQHRNTRNRVISLVLHSVILLLAVFLLAGLSFTYTQVSVKRDVILLVDASDSTVASRDDMNDFIDSVLGELDPDHRVGIVTFAGDCVYAAELDGDADDVKREYAQAEQKPAAGATDMSSALMYAKDLLDDPRDGRIIVLSDGLQTDGNAMLTVKTLVDAGVRVDTVYFPTELDTPEVQINDVEVTLSGGGAEAVVSVQSTRAQSATLTMYDNGVKVSDQAVHLSGDADTFSFAHIISDAELHVLKITLDAEYDTYEQNNSYYSYVNVSVSTKTLLVDGSGNGAADLRGLLDGKFDLTVKTLADMPTTLDGLKEYSEVILMNVANADLPNGFDDVLTEYVKVQGGGLYTVGGDKAYLQDDMEGTKFQELLPVEANTDAKSLGLLLVIDNSGSMKEIAANTGLTRMELAKKAAIASVNTLGDEDYVGVIAFDADAEVVCDMFKIDRKNDIIDRINGIEADYGTYYTDAIQKAHSIMSSFTATELKHIIFLTDGEPDQNTDMGVVYEYVDRIAQNNTTLSVIALGSSVDTSKAAEMAERGGGRFEDVERESELINVMVEETTTAAGQYHNEFDFTPVIISHTPALAGVSELPILGGFYGTRIKKDATTVLGYEGSPIYAEWRVGEGKVGSIMCDLEGKWSANLFTDDNGKRFITNTVNSLLSDSESVGGAVTVSFTTDNYTTQANITAALGRTEALMTSLKKPDGTTVDITPQKLTEQQYVCNFRTDDVGVYTLTVTRLGGAEEETYSFYTAFSYSDEYNVMEIDDEAAFNFMQSLSLDGNGSILFTANNIFASESESLETEYDPTLVLLIVCSVLFLADIVVRKFKLKLPERKKSAVE